MIERTLSRRQVLLGSLLGGSALGFAVTLPASAMLQKSLPANGELGTAIANRCQSNDGGAHAQLIADLQAALMLQPGIKGEVLTRTAVCPICGCPVTATRSVL